MAKDTTKICTPPYAYLILGSGRQGFAAAYDLVKFGEAGKVTFADANLEIAETAASRLAALTGFTQAAAVQLDVRQESSLVALLAAHDAALSAVPYYFNVAITKAAIAASCHLCDMGGYTDIVRQQLAMDREAHLAGISVVPDCGMGPGLINTMAAYAIDMLEDPHSAIIYDAGLPQDPTPPWNYQLTFHINGLTNEMDGKAIFLRNGQITAVETLTEPEFIDFPPFGRLEADVTSGGTSTAPYTFQNRLQNYENKVLRYPGHYEWLRAYKTLGLFSETPIKVGEQTIVPRQLYHTLLEPKISAPVVKDVGIIRAIARGMHQSKPTQVTVDLIDRYDEATGFTAMERLTGWHCSIMMAFQVRGAIPAGAFPVESAVQAGRFMQELPRRGLNFSVEVTEIDSL